jgi:hypothetical protein
MVVMVVTVVVCCGDDGGSGGRLGRIRRLGAIESEAIDQVPAQQKKKYGSRWSVTA